MLSSAAECQASAERAQRFEAVAQVLASCGRGMVTPVIVILAMSLPPAVTSPRILK